MKRFGFALLKYAAIAVFAFAFVRLIIAYPPPPSPEQLLPYNEKLCREVLNMRCKVVLKK